MTPDQQGSPSPKKRDATPRFKLSDALVEKWAKRPPKRGPSGATAQRIYTDSTVQGFGVRVTSGGAVSFVFSYTSPETGASRRYTIGPFGADTGGWDAKRARQEAVRLRAMVDVDHVDPFEQEHRDAREVRRLAEEEDDRLTFAKAAAEFLRQEVDLEGDGALRPATRREYRRHLDKHLIPALGDKEVFTITKLDVLAIRNKLSATAFEANHALRVLRRVLNWSREIYPKTLSGFDVGSLFKAKASATGRRTVFLDEPVREEWVSDPAKLGALIRELKASATATARVALFSLYTGCRKRDALRARWDQFRFDESTWTVPAATRKGNRAHAFSMNAEFVALVQAIRAEGKRGPWVFPSNDPNEPMPEINYNLWRDLCTRAGVGGLRPHDLKRTVVSRLLESGIDSKTIAETVGNADPRVIERRYAHVRSETRRKTIAGWTDYMHEAEGQAEAPLADVVPIKGKKP